MNTAARPYWISRVSRVEDRQEIVADEAARVTGFAGSLPEAVLERRQRADPATQFYGSAPAGGGQVHPCQPWPAQRQDAAKNDEGDEQEVQDDDAVGQEAVDHADLRTLR